MNAYWSYILPPIGIIGIILQGRKNRWGWIVGIFAQVIWVTYAAATRQWGFLPQSIIYGLIYAWNFIDWSGYKPWPWIISLRHAGRRALVFSRKDT